MSFLQVHMVLCIVESGMHRYFSRLQVFGYVLKVTEIVFHYGGILIINSQCFLQDVAVKVYFGNQCSEETLLDYKKEVRDDTSCQLDTTLIEHKFLIYSLPCFQVEIMKRLRHPNVLLFMGAVYSQDKSAIVTEFLPRY